MTTMKLTRPTTPSLSPMASPSSVKSIQVRVFIGIMLFCSLYSVRQFLLEVPVRNARNIIPEHQILPNACTPQQLDSIQRQLPPDACLRTRTTPWMQRCSLTQNTKCPDSSWIDNHYYKNQKRKSFLGISVGCNKAFDAIQAMRRGSGNSKFDKSAWRHALQEASGGQVSQGVCNQESGEQFDLKNSTILENAEMHCIEPMPVTVKALQQASQQLQYDTTGFFVTHAAIAKQSGSTYFPRASLSNQAHMKVQVGSENQGMESCGNAKTAMKDPKCQEVKMYSLDDYANKFIHQSSDSAIQILSIDVEGYDYDVMLGGMNATLPRVEYLEFEYNWMGAWRSQKLQDAIQKLDLLHFSCYWAGSRGRLWRITNCFLDYFEVKHWSNVACVNRLRVPELAMEMERVFEQTLAAA